LSAMPALVEESLSYADGERLVSLAAWPCAIVEDGGSSTGFVMPAIPQEFFIELATVKGVSNSTAEFQHLLNHSSVLAARGITLDDAQRYSLLREVASGLAFLHKHGVCVGDVSPKNLLFSLAPHEAVYFIDCDAMRIDGVSALQQVETPGWGVPAGEELATIYSDTYKLGLLALRLLAGDHDTTNPGHLPSTTPSLLRQIITDTVSNEQHRRPLPEAWSYVLGHAIEEAQHRKKTAAPAVAPLAAPETPVVRSRPSGDSAPPVRPSAPPPPPPPASTPPASRPASSNTAGWAAALFVAVLVVVGLIGVLANHNTGTPSSAPQTSTIEPSSDPGQSSTLPPTPKPAATALPSPAGSADIAGLAPFAREWKGMRESVVIDATGHGHFHYMMACASCSMADMPYSTMDFTLTSVSGGTARGGITASSDPQHPVGEPVAATLAPQDTIRWSLGGKNVGLFCGSNPAWCGY
jgi:eukaryotic-like serine/threonine-protein kinase